jgi:hypothetical protein
LSSHFLFFGVQVQPPNSCANVMGEYFPLTLLPRLKNEGRPNIDVAWRFACRYSAHPLFQRHHPPCPPLPRHAESNWGFEPWASGLGGQEPGRGSDYPAMVNREGPPRAAKQLCSNQQPAASQPRPARRRLAQKTREPQGEVMFFCKIIVTTK